MKRIAVLASGSGSNLQAIMDAIERRDITNAEVAVVISDRKNAYALERARQKSIPVKHQSSKNYQSREDYDRDLVTYLTEQQIDLVVLAGFMRLMTPHFVAAYPNRILNIHPSLLPAFPGAHGVRDALAYGVKVAGCTVHFVDEGMDTGPIILQEAVPVYDSDTEESLQERIHELEHRLYPRAIELWVQDKIKIQGRRCFIDD
ncbi:phosphoribosylglycinamide formyltransferase [Dethiobacter alkaliphilus]|uniref:phosphoribosylglycinamide formyltransferase n=1 Tax=Dethiobacter alkaliphilus TaxID=427926 RepID=UPI0022267D45|nr:phosphoribosylglycinamide formyltransferase [Dethiobacter alkaliphilus]MCW3490043.1 phosphoribosylglycinamide formyltransferase [Dethiobacter alkaliphilus]